jgi:hypothetical protein
MDIPWAQPTPIDTKRKDKKACKRKTITRRNKATIPREMVMNGIDPFKNKISVWGKDTKLHLTDFTVSRATFLIFPQFNWFL